MKKYGRFSELSVVAVIAVLLSYPAHSSGRVGPRSDPPSDLILFVAAKSGPGSKNRRYRDAARETWLDLLGMAELPPGSTAYRFFVDGPCCLDETLEFGDVVVRHRGPAGGGGVSGAGGAPAASSWLPRRFSDQYRDPSINYKSQWGDEAVRDY